MVRSRTPADLTPACPGGRRPKFSSPADGEPALTLNLDCVCHFDQSKLRRGAASPATVQDARIRNYPTVNFDSGAAGLARATAEPESPSCLRSAAAARLCCAIIAINFREEEIDPDPPLQATSVRNCTRRSSCKRNRSSRSSARRKRGSEAGEGRTPSAGETLAFILFSRDFRVQEPPRKKHCTGFDHQS